MRRGSGEVESGGIRRRWVASARSSGDGRQARAVAAAAPVEVGRRRRQGLRLIKGPGARLARGGGGACPPRTWRWLATRLGTLCRVGRGKFFFKNCLKKILIKYKKILKIPEIIFTV